MYATEKEGDNLEFNVAVISTVTIYLNQTGTNTATAIYPNADNVGTARKFAIIADKSFQINGMNSKTFTNPKTVTLNTWHAEKRNIPTIGKIVVRTTADDTNFKVRWF